MSNALQQMPEHIDDKALTAKIMYGKIVTKKDVKPEQIDVSKGFIKIVNTNKDLIAVLKYTPAGSRYSYCCVFN